MNAILCKLRVRGTVSGGATPEYEVRHIQVIAETFEDARRCCYDVNLAVLHVCDFVIVEVSNYLNNISNDFLISGKILESLYAE